MSGSKLVCSKSFLTMPVWDVHLCAWRGGCCDLKHLDHWPPCSMMRARHPAVFMSSLVVECLGHYLHVNARNQCSST